MAVKPNPARILHGYLVSAINQRNGMSGNEPSGLTVWSTLFEVPNNSPDLAGYMNQISDLVSEVSVSISSRHPEIFPSLEGPLNKLLVAVMKSSAPWSASWAKAADPSTLDLLNVSAALLDTSDHIGLVVHSQTHLYGRVTDLLLDVTDAVDVLGEEVVAQVTRHLRSLLSYLDPKRIDRSSEGLIPIIEGAAGAIVGDHTLVEKLLKSPAGKALVGGLIALRLFTGPVDFGSPAELPPPDPAVIVELESNCYAPPALEAGEEVRELESGSEEPPADQRPQAD
jgi:hypothetical protein